jgi:predicted nucleic acid-binding protein
LTSSARTASERGIAAAYVDASALVKLVVDEPESEALRHAFGGTPLVSTAIVATEFLRAVRRGSPRLTDAAIARLARVDTVPIAPDILVLAGLLGPPTVRALDAIHLLTALVLQPYVSPLITYDRRLAEAAEALGLAVASPRE